ncbi:MAG: phospholipid carrier-dependent glycosyltransferase [Actinomycetota bacterium]|nr:phospholipid carrier-dependent glycosyltransferase [Actinomycetota bacterium]
MAAAEPERPAETEPPPPPPPARGWSGFDWLALGGVTLGSAALRLARLADPRQLIFDEIYYARDACWYVYASPSVCGISGESTMVHPPMSKWLIAIGIRIFGYDSFGWRIAAAVAGVVTVALLYLLARKVLGSTLGATLAAGLLGIDFLHFVQSRTSMLDIFIPMFGVAALLFVAYDRDRMLAALDRPPEERAHGLLDRPWRLAAGAAGAGAVASKWSGGLILLIAIVLTIAWEVGARRRDGHPRPGARFTREELPSIALWLVIVPVLLYGLTYAGRIGGSYTALPWSEDAWVNNVWNQQLTMADFHVDLEATHGYQSPWWSWILLKRPVSYAYCGGSSCDPPAAEGEVREVLATGSPFVWGASILAVLFALWRWVRRWEWWKPKRGARDAIGGPEGLVVAGFLLTYLPWIGLTWNRDAVFLFYILPTIPFMCLALAWVATRIGWTWEAKTAVGLFSLGAVALFVFYYPILANTSLSENEWRARVRAFDDCEVPEPEESTTTIVETVDGKEIERIVTSSDEGGGPPSGWCWI